MSPAREKKQVVRKEVKRDAKTGMLAEAHFYNGKERIARERFDIEGNCKVSGKIPDGNVNQYDENGKLKKVWHYMKNKLQGLSVGYYENGAIKEEEDFQQGELQGITKLFYASGVLRSEESYRQGKLDGVTMDYYENGKIKRLDQYKNDECLERKNYNEEGNEVKSRN